MTHRMLGVALALSLLGVEVAAAQVRQITGRVTMHRPSRVCLRLRSRCSARRSWLRRTTMDGSP